MPRNYEKEASQQKSMRERMMQEKSNPVPEPAYSRSTQDSLDQACQAMGMEVPLIDQLRAKRANIAQDAARRTKKLDRQITMLDQSNAEEILNSARLSLYED